MSRTEKLKLAARRTGGLGSSLKETRTTTTSSRAHRTLPAPVKGESKKTFYSRDDSGNCATGAAHGPADSQGHAQIPAYHCSNTAAFADAFDDDHSAQWQWIRGHAKQQGQQLDSESDDCSSWFQSPFSATLSAYPSPVTPAVLQTSASGGMPDSFYTPIRPASAGSKPLSSSFRVPDHTGSYSASFSAKTSKIALCTTAPPNLQLSQRRSGSPAVAPRQLNFAHEVDGAPFTTPHTARQLQQQHGSNSVDFVSILQARHEAFRAEEGGAFASIQHDGQANTTRNSHLPLHTPPRGNSDAPLLSPHTTGAVPKGRLAAARERLRQNVRLQRARSEDVMMFHNPCAHSRSVSPLPPYPDVSSSQTSSSIRGHATAPLRSKSSGHTCDPPADQHPQQSPTYSDRSKPESLHPTPFTYVSSLPHSQQCSQRATTAFSSTQEDPFATLQLPVPPRAPQGHQHSYQLVDGSIVHDVEDYARVDHSVLQQQDRGLTLHSCPEQGLRNTATPLTAPSVRRFPVEYQVPPMTSSRGGSDVHLAGELLQAMHS